MKQPSKSVKECKSMYPNSDKGPATKLAAPKLKRNTACLPA